MAAPIIDSAPNTTRDVTDTFMGYNHNLKINAGEWFDCTNLTTDLYPLLANRKSRGIVIDNPYGLHHISGLLEKDALAYVDNGTLYYNGEATGLTGMTDDEKQMVGMGAYICIFPDQKYINTQDLTDYGDMGASFHRTGTVKYQVCQVTGDPYNVTYTQAEEPSNPQSGDIWLDNSTSVPVLKEWSSSQGEWVSIATVYTKISFGTFGAVPAKFKEFDGVTIEGSYYADELDGSKVIFGVGGDSTHEDYIIVIGLLPVSHFEDADGDISVSRLIPKMDFVCECQNRLWGCFYGMKVGQTINEIYCCALGDFKNWNQFQGIATDSYVASVGSDGQWTGAVNYLGNPVFMKENHIHVVSVSSSGAHQISETTARGVQKGSHKSLAIVNEVLFYKSRQDVCAWQGGFPSTVSENLGQERYTEAVGGVSSGKYYISMKDTEGVWHLFVFDSQKHLWIHEDNLRVTSFASVDDELYAATVDGFLLAMNGTVGTPENGMQWMAESGILYYLYPDRKYVSRYDIRMKMEEGAMMDIFCEYDSNGRWIHSGTVRFKGTNSVVIPIRARRCDHMKFRLVGMGNVRIFSIARILEQGSDV